MYAKNSLLKKSWVFIVLNGLLSRTRSPQRPLAQLLLFTRDTPAKPSTKEIAAANLVTADNCLNTLLFGQSANKPTGQQALKLRGILLKSWLSSKFGPVRTEPVGERYATVTGNAFHNMIIP